MLHRVYQTIPHLSTPSPACYPYQNAPNLAQKTNLSDQSQSALPVTCNMPVPPPSHIPIAHSTSPGMAQASNNPVAQSTSQGMSHNTPSSTQVLAAVVGSSSNSKGTVRSPQRRSPSSQYSFPKGSESPNWRERSSPLTQLGLAKIRVAPFNNTMLQVCHRAKSSYRVVVDILYGRI